MTRLFELLSAFERIVAATLVQPKASVPKEVGSGIASEGEAVAAES